MIRRRAVVALRRRLSLPSRLSLRRRSSLRPPVFAHCSRRPVSICARILAGGRSGLNVWPVTSHRILAEVPARSVTLAFPLCCRRLRACARPFTGRVRFARRHSRARGIAVCSSQRVRPDTLTAELSQPLLSRDVGVIVRLLAIVPPPAHCHLHPPSREARKRRTDRSMRVKLRPTGQGSHAHQGAATCLSLPADWLQSSGLPFCVKAQASFRPGEFAETAGHQPGTTATRVLPLAHECTFPLLRGFSTGPRMLFLRSDKLGYRYACPDNSQWSAPVAGGAMDRQVKYLLPESQMPQHWYNVVADLPSPPPPPLHPGTGQPVGPDDLAPLFPAALIAQEVSGERHIAIPDDVLDVYRLWRPTPLFRARRLERDLGTPARIYYKYEGGSPAGSHKPNTAVPQAYYNAAEGVTKLTTETGAGQWGSALAFASALFGLELEVWMVRASYDQKPYRKMLMETYGAVVHASPSDLTNSGRGVLAENPDSTGSLGIAISEAVEVAAGDPNARYALGSVLNHVLMHQTIIGEEALKQLAEAGDTPDVIVGCTGGGSNFGGLTFPFLREKLAGRMNPVIRAVEPAACPSFTRGVYAYDFGDTAGLTPLLKMHTLGHEFIPDPIHAGGLRYHGMSPLLSHIYELGLIEAVAKAQSECFAAGLRFARTEGIVPAPEPTHAVAACIEEALRCKETGEEKVILTALCGHGLLDLAAYGDYMSGELRDLELSDKAIQEAMAGLPAPAV